jgi:hypothetical protein
MFTKEINKFKKKGKKMLMGDFIVSEGHGHPLVEFLKLVHRLITWPTHLG